MIRRCVAWFVVILSVAAAAALLIPRSPFYLPELLNQRAQHRKVSDSVRQLSSPEAEARAQACYTLGAAGADAAESVPALAGVLVGDPDTAVRRAAALALLKLTPASREAVPQLTQALTDQEAVVRAYAALTLYRLHDDARPAVAALLIALVADNNDTNAEKFTFTVREVVALALGRASAGTADAVPALMAALQAASTDPMRRAVAQALGEVGPPAAPALPLLRALFDSKDPDVRDAANRATGRIESGSSAPK